MTANNQNPVAFAIDRKDLTSVRIDRNDYKIIQDTHEQLVSFFKSRAAPVTDLTVRGGRSNNAPAMYDTLHFLLQHCTYTREDLEHYALRYATEQVLATPLQEVGV